MHLKLLTTITAPYSPGMIRDLWAIQSIRETWTRITSANGGYLTGTFEISNMATSDIKDFFNRYLGFEVQEHTINAMTWNGFIYRMTLELNGVQYVRTLEPDWFHNRVKVYYSNMAVEDTSQGALVYRAAPIRFSDDAQDFSAWETLVGDAVYRIQVANSERTTSWGYLGAASTVTNPNDTIAVYQDIGLATPGWNDTDPALLPSVPLSYQVIEIEFEGTRYDTAWAENTDSEDAFGTVEYILSMGGAEFAAADALRDRHLTEFGYPRTRMVGGIDIILGTQRQGARLTVECAGFVATLFWKYRYTSRTNAISGLLYGTTLISEFVTATPDDSITTNTLISNVDCYPMPQRLGDLIQILVDQGDAAGNAYQWGVYDRMLYYEPQPTTPTYFLSNGQLFDTAGTRVIPQMLHPGFLLKAREAPLAPRPLGATITAEGDVAYVEQVEFSAPNRLRLTLSGASPIDVLSEQIQSGSYDGNS